MKNKSLSHRLSLIDEQNRKADCIVCGRVSIRKKGKGWRCNRSPHSLGQKDRKRLEYRQGVGMICERCGFVPEHLCQLDVHHINKNHNDNSPENRMTLCANCHRLQTWKERQN